MVIWFSGMSGAGKSTASAELYKMLKPVVPELVLLDGDEVREAFGNDLGFTEADRKKQVSRVQRLARLLSIQGFVVLVALVYSHPELVEWNRRNIADFHEVLVDAPLDFVIQRDSKGLYGRALRGEASNVVGVDISWHRPAHADLIFDATKTIAPAEIARSVCQGIPSLAARLAGSK